MNRKLIVLCGISGSGKSTFAKQYIKDNPNTVRVNRDDMRRQVLGELTQDYYCKKNSKVRGPLEKHINVLQNEQIRYWLLEGYDVIADNTHLREDDIVNYERNFGYLADIYIKPFPIDLSEAFFRVSDREELGSDLSYITPQYLQFNKLEIVKSEQSSPLGIFIPKKECPVVEHNPELYDCYIVDLDGTCADCTGVRSPYDGENLYLDKPIEPVLVFLERLYEVEIIYVSGREDKWMEDSKKWLIDNYFPEPNLIYMRKTGDFRPDTVVKKEIYEQNIKGRYNVLGCIDDRKSVQRMWVDECGLFVFDVNQKDKIF